MKAESQGGARSIKPPHLVVRQLGGILIHQVIATAICFSELWATAPAAVGTWTSHRATAMHEASASIQTQQLPTVRGAETA